MLTLRVDQFFGVGSRGKKGNHVDQLIKEAGSKQSLEDIWQNSKTGRNLL
ncbi:MAG: hypothetical protein QF907_09280 [Nitrospinota bacterium]|jgi:hypothetical protein|nr:hypothetical protein [Nitrospinota bacterium]HJN01829.1 hypothetical protein [Nitrospinota bacterium]